ncbi:MAG: hypothetical protein ACJ8R9_24135 [Steroidobacteraceae bacterium]
MVARRIALVKPASAVEEKITHALQLFDSILWAFQGATRSIWTLAPPEAAEVIVVHEGDPDQRIPAWRAGGKLIVEISVRDNASCALVYPFKASQALAVLERLDVQLNSQDDPQEANLSPGAGVARPSQEPWSFVETLRTIAEVQNSEAWLVARDAKVPCLWLRADGALYAAEQATIHAIRHGTLNLANLTLQRAPPPDGGPGSRAGAELSWFAGYHASADLAPWLKRATRYRVTHWPNFGLIRPLPSQIRIAAALTSTPARADEIAARASVSIEQATRTFNALAVANVLVAVGDEVASMQTSRPPTMAPRGGLAAFLSNVRKHLGLGS